MEIYDNEDRVVQSKKRRVRIFIRFVIALCILLVITIAAFLCIDIFPFGFSPGDTLTTYLNPLVTLLFVFVTAINLGYLYYSELAKNEPFTKFQADWINQRIRVKVENIGNNLLSDFEFRLRGLGWGKTEWELLQDADVESVNKELKREITRTGEHVSFEYRVADDYTGGKFEKILIEVVYNAVYYGRITRAQEVEL